MNASRSQFYEVVPGSGLIQPDPLAAANPAYAPAPPPQGVAAVSPEGKLPDLGLFMSSLGVNDPDARAELTAEIYLYVFETGIYKITPQLTEAEKTAARQLRATGPINEAAFAQFFQGPTRQPALQEAFVEALDVVTEQANKPAVPPPA